MKDIYTPISLSIENTLFCKKWDEYITIISEKSLGFTKVSSIIDQRLYIFHHSFFLWLERRITIFFDYSTYFRKSQIDESLRRTYGRNITIFSFKSTTKFIEFSYSRREESSRNWSRYYIFDEEYLFFCLFFITIGIDDEGFSWRKCENIVTTWDISTRNFRYSHLIDKTKCHTFSYRYTRNIIRCSEGFFCNKLSPLALFFTKWCEYKHSSFFVWKRIISNHSFLPYFLVFSIFYLDKRKSIESIVFSYIWNTLTEASIEGSIFWFDSLWHSLFFRGSSISEWPIFSYSPKIISIYSSESRQFFFMSFIELILPYFPFRTHIIFFDSIFDHLPKLYTIFSHILSCKFYRAVFWDSEGLETIEHMHVHLGCYIGLYGIK